MKTSVKVIHTIMILGYVTGHAPGASAGACDNVGYVDWRTVRNNCPIRFHSQTISGFAYDATRNFKENHLSYVNGRGDVCTDAKLRLEERQMENGGVDGREMDKNTMFLKGYYLDDLEPLIVEHLDTKKISNNATRVQRINCKINVGTLYSTSGSTMPPGRSVMATAISTDPRSNCTYGIGDLMIGISINPSCDL